MSTTIPVITSLEQILGKSCSREEVLNSLKQHPESYAIFSSFRPEHQNTVLSFMQGQCSLDITLDKFFLYVLNPDTHKDRLESLLSSFLGQPVTIKAILPREGVQLAEKGSLVIMDIIVELCDGSTVDVEMQKVGYHFPGQRSDCYTADMIMRQYNRVRSEKNENFSYKDLKPVHLFILMEKSPREFHKFSDQYIHERQISYSSGLQLPSLSHITYISLDTFHSMGQNISTELDAWLTFFSCTDAEHIVRLVQKYPKFLEYYKDLAVFRTKPKELIYMFSEALEILDRNTANYMIDEMAQEMKSVKEQLDSAKSELDSTKSELDSARKDSAAKDHLISSKDEEIAELRSQIEALKHK
ncbi:MAG: PD-(D/E)XK nuclease family transposase [Lachnospiraceae bacterium]|nr:PD-(D/E)XK nuclease family transposase [Lachnospiraceae bacterium]